MSRIILQGLSLVGEQKIAPTGTAVVSINSTCKGGSYLIFSVEAGNARARFGATAPAASTGILYAAGYVYELPQYSGSALLRFTAANSTVPIINLASFQRAGEV